MPMHAVDLRFLKDTDVLEIGGGAHDGSTTLRSMALLVSVCSLLDQPATIDAVRTGCSALGPPILR